MKTIILWILVLTMTSVSNAQEEKIIDEVSQVKNTEATNQLNQEELMKQFIGLWKIEIAEDTTAFADLKSYGKVLEGYWKIVSKGKTLSEIKLIIGYQSKTDKFIQFATNKEQGLVDLSAYYFVSNNKYIQIPYSAISNPDNASRKVEGEFKSPDMFVDKLIVNNKLLRTDTYVRIK